jgi:hypothetical protein
VSVQSFENHCLVIAEGMAIVKKKTQTILNIGCTPQPINRNHTQSFHGKSLYKYSENQWRNILPSDNTEPFQSHLVENTQSKRENISCLQQCV